MKIEHREEINMSLEHDEEKDEWILKYRNKTHKLNNDSLLKVLVRHFWGVHSD